MRISTGGWAVALLAVAGSAQAGDNNYRTTILVASEAEDAPVVDELLVNAWGLAASPRGPWWVANNGTDTATVYTGAGAKLNLEVAVPGSPTGTVWHGDGGFLLEPGVPARFLFATQSGTFLGWSPLLSDPSTAVVTFSDPGSIYTGLAILGNRLYTADFTECQVEAFDDEFEEIEDLEFSERTIPEGYCPFGIQAIGDSIFVAYALSGGEEEIPGEGLGLVREYDAEGNLVAVVGSHGRLNAPWGMALAPEDFGKFGGCLLVGNFGDGLVNAFCKDDDGDWRHAGRLRERGRELVVDGLWGIGFGNGGLAGPTNVLYFAAGPEEETEGYYGKIEAVR